MRITNRIKNITRLLERASAPAEEDEPALEIRIGEIVGSVLVKFDDRQEVAYTVTSIARRYPLADEPNQYDNHPSFYEDDFEWYEQVFDTVQAFVKKLAEET